MDGIIQVGPFAKKFVHYELQKNYEICYCELAFMIINQNILQNNDILRYRYFSDNIFIISIHKKLLFATPNHLLFYRIFV